MLSVQYAICAYFKFNSMPIECLQLYYTPNDSSIRMVLFCQEQQSRYTLQAMIPYIHPCFVILYTSISTMMNLKVPTTVLNTKQLPNYKGQFFLQVQTSHDLWFATSTLVYILQCLYKYKVCISMNIYNFYIILGSHSLKEPCLFVTVYA